MKLTIKLTSIFLFLGIVLGLASLGAPNASAQQAKSISIAPLRKEAEVNPGLAYDGSLLIKNSGTKTQTIDLSAETFNVTNQAYDYLFQPETPESRWVSFEKTSLTLKAGESATVTYRVNVPIDAEPAGYYLALFALNRPPKTPTGGISSTERVASLLYLTVTGDASRSGNLVQIQSPLVVFSHAAWSATLQNTGTLHYRSTYSSIVRTVFGNQVSYAEDSKLILPASVRLIEGTINLPEIAGLYKITYTVSLGDAPSQQITRWFLYVPPLQTILALLIIAGLTTLLRKRRRTN